MSDIKTLRKDLRSVVLRADEASLVLLNFGASTCDWRVKLGDKRVPMILGFDDLRDYVKSPYYFGAIVGRVSNRIGGGAYQGPEGPVQLHQNEGRSALHGGPESLARVNWDIQHVSDNQARLSYVSPEGESGFPGTVRFEVDVTLDTQQISYVMRATTDQPTPVSLAQHNYYNFGGTPDIWDYSLRCPTHQLLEQNELGVSTGVVLDTTDGARDLCNLAPLQRFQSDGLDQHFLFDTPDTPAGVVREVATIHRRDGLGVRVLSDQLGAQIYTANGMGDMTGGLDGHSYGASSGICFEPQGHPNAVNIPEFPSVMITPDHPYEQRLIVQAIGSDP